MVKNTKSAGIFCIMKGNNMPIISLFIEEYHTAYFLERYQQKMLEKLNRLRLFPAVSTFTEAKEWIAIFEGRSGWFENYAEKRKIENQASAEEVKAAGTTF